MTTDAAPSTLAPEPSPPAAATSGPAPATTLRAEQRAEQHGALAVLELTGWCALLLVAVNTAVALVLVTVPGLADLASTGAVLAVGSWIALVPVLVAGWPLGVVTAALLSRVPREGVHVLVFALVGAVAALLLGQVGRTSAPDPVLALVLAAEGALGAGGGRYLLGRARRARAARAQRRVGRTATGAEGVAR